MNGNHDKFGLLAIFPPDADIDSSRLRLEAAGIRQEQITLLSPVPMAVPKNQANPPFWPYGITIGAGLVGIGVGLFFAAGTAALYPLMTGGKPIVAAPVVGIISYETMMLLAIVVTFLTMIVRIRRAQGTTAGREPRINDGKLALSVQFTSAEQEVAVRRLLETAGAEEIRLVSHGPPLSGQRAFQALAVWILCALATAGCSPDMQEQPSYRSQESPRLHSPSGSIPRQSRMVAAPRTLTGAHPPNRAQELYRINCLPCHGHSGEGTGPVAPYLNELPANLLAPRVRALSNEQLYDVITNGKDMMPSFKGELSATERMMIASFIHSMEPDGTPSQP